MSDTNLGMVRLLNGGKHGFIAGYYGKIDPTLVFNKGTGYHVYQHTVHNHLNTSFKFAKAL